MLNQKELAINTAIVLVQLRGRSGRQGDPGSSRFFLSLEDNIFRIFGGDRIQVYSLNENLLDCVALRYTSC